MRRFNAPLMLLLAFSACKGGGGGPTTVQPALGTIEIPTSWQSTDAAIVMRLTNSSTADTETKRALNQIFNDPNDPVDLADFLMRSPERDEAGELVPVDTSLSQTELLGGSSIEQMEAYRQKLVDGDQLPFTREEAVDSCGNEQIMALASPHVMQQVFPQGPQNLDVWPASCPDGADCQTLDGGTWDVAFTELRFDGMVDMVINVFPGLEQDPAKPGVWGHISAFFLTDNNPGFPWLSLFANARRVQVNLLSVWQLDRTYVDPMGVREVYKFPHRARTMDPADVFVFIEPYRETEAYWNAQGLGPDQPTPYGATESAAVLIDQTSVIGEAVARQAGEDTAILSTLYDALTYQIATAVACPAVGDRRYIRQGPVEFFVCADTDIDTCIAQEDMEEIACVFEEEPVFDPFNPAQSQINFPRAEVTGPGDVTTVTENQLPTYVSSIVAFEATLEITVTEDSVLYLYSDVPIGTITNTATNLPVELPAPIGNTHCTESTIRRYDLGTSWDPGTYRIAVDLAAAEGIVEETDLIGGSTFLYWMYYTSVPAWAPGG